MRYGDELAYVALVVDDVEAAAAVWQNDFDLERSDHATGDGRESVPLFRIGHTALALFSSHATCLGEPAATGVHHLALAVEDLDAASDGLVQAGVAAETGNMEPGLDGGRRLLLSVEAANGLRTYLSDRVEHGPARPGYVERLDHIEVLGTDNEKAIDVYCKRLGCRFEGEQTDTEMQIAVEHFVYSRSGTVRAVVHNRPAELVASVHDIFVGAGDCELEILQVLDQGLQTRAVAGRPGDTRQDHGALARFLQRRGPGLHHLALKVADVDHALDRLHRAGHRLIDRHSRPGARCSRIGFIHPGSMHGVLVHLVEREEDR